MREQTIVGAGLSGLVAAITLARKGHKVTVRERRKSVGGPVRLEGGDRDTTIIAGDGTPMQLEAMKRYLGIDLSPVAAPIPRLELHIYGKYKEVEFAPGVETYLFERGPRPSSLDVYLYEMARELDVEFSFEDSVAGVEEFAALPPGTIIASGLFPEAYEFLDIPTLPIWCCLAHRKAEDETETRVIIYFDEFTRDYGFLVRVNGIEESLLFSREWEIRPEHDEEFQERLRNDYGVEFTNWSTFNLRAPFGGFRRPELFRGDYILTGTLSGTFDPIISFGIHGALVSGKIAALAVEEPVIAEREFRRINRPFALGLVNSYIFRYCPVPILKRALWLGTSIFPYLGGTLQNLSFLSVPGYYRL